MTNREYKSIPNFSNYFACTDGHVYFIEDNEFIQMKERMHPDGYLDVAKPFYAKGSNYVHRVIAITFLGYPKGYSPHKWVVDHINNDHLDNRLENLEWVTQAENLRRARSQGKWPKGKQKILCKTTGKIYESIAEASRDFDIRYWSIYGAMESGGQKICGYEFERI